MERTCRKCGVNPTRDSTHWDCKKCFAEWAKEYSASNPERVAANRHRRDEERRLIRQKAKEKPCADCGVSYPHYVMDFDHLGDKRFTLGSQSMRFSVQVLLKEIAKCDVVCSNCHRIRTFKRMES